MAAKKKSIQKAPTKKQAVKAPAKKTKPAPKPKAEPKPAPKPVAKPTEKATNKAILFNGKPRIISIVVQGGQALVVDATNGRKQYVANAPNGVEVTVKVC